jgi:hypothetical protein
MPSLCLLSAELVIITLHTVKCRCLFDNWRRATDSIAPHDWLVGKHAGRYGLLIFEVVYGACRNR